MEALLAEVESACMESLKDSFKETTTRTFQPMEVEVIRSLGRQEVVFLMLVNALAQFDAQMSTLLLRLAVKWNVIPSIVTAQFNVPKDILERAVRFARRLHHSDLFTTPEGLRTHLDQLLEKLSASTVQTEVPQASAAPEETPAAAQPPPPQPRMSRLAVQRQLWEGVEKDEGQLVEAAVLSGADLGVVRADKGYRSPLALAASEGRASAVRALLRLGAQLEEKVGKEERTVLHLAIEGGHEEVVRELLAAGASTEALDSSEFTPLHLASQNGHETIVKHLLAAGASVLRECTPRHVVSPAYVFLTMLRDLQPDLPSAQEKANSTYTPLHLASREGHQSVVRVLLEAGASIEAKTSSSYTPLHLAARNGNEAVVMELLEAGACVRAETSSGATPLHLAAAGGHLSSVTLLVEDGAADINTRDNRGWTPLFYAEHYKQPKVAEYLRSVKAIR